MAPHLAPNTPQDWNYTTVPQTALNGRILPYPLGHVLGGTTAISGLLLTPMSITPSIQAPNAIIF